MLIAIAIAEEIQGLQRSALLSCQNPAEDILGLSAPHESIYFEDLTQNNKISNLSQNTRRLGRSLRRSSKNEFMWGTTAWFCQSQRKLQSSNLAELQCNLM